MVDNKRTDSSHVAMQLVLNLYMPLPNPHTAFVVAEPRNFVLIEELERGSGFSLSLNDVHAYSNIVGYPQGLAWHGCSEVLPCTMATSNSRGPTKDLMCFCAFFLNRRLRHSMAVSFNWRRFLKRFKWRRSEALSWAIATNLTMPLAQGKIVRVGAPP
mmetsp:Transcript_44724/g.71967  ORF Transcript_44724/g.71967 Transcript_44724/m.71967 type:complete len:158 (+) Transcript_44724:271-744(+)